MGDKNESIHLWLLQQERQKGRALTIEQTPEITATLQSIPDNLLLGGKDIVTEEHQPSTLPGAINLEQLMKQTAVLEEESHRLEEQERQLSLRARMLCEKAIHELKKKNAEKQQQVAQLKEGISNLEIQLRDLSSSDSQREGGPGTMESMNTSKPSSPQEQILPSNREGTPVEITEEISRIIRASSIAT